MPTSARTTGTFAPKFGGYRSGRAATATIRSELPGHPAPPPRPGFRVPGRRGAAGRGRRDPRANRLAGDPAGLGRRVDLRPSDGPHPGDGPRRRGPQAVPLPREVARAPRRGEVPDDDGVRPRAAADARAGGGRPRPEELPAREDARLRRAA